MGVVMEKRRTIGVGVVSLGWMGRLHTRAYKALAEKFPEIDVNMTGFVLRCGSGKPKASSGPAGILHCG